MEVFEFKRAIRFMIPNTDEETAQKVADEIIGKVRGALREATEGKALVAAVEGDSKPRMLPLDDRTVEKLNAQESFAFAGKVDV